MSDTRCCNTYRDPYGNTYTLEEVRTLAFAQVPWAMALLRKDAGYRQVAPGQIEPIDTRQLEFCF
jgi:hypothetical protein